MPDGLLDKPGTRKRGNETIAIERGDRDLNVDHVFRGETGHCCRPDVVDPKSEASEPVSNGVGGLEFGRPARFWLDDRDLPIHVRNLLA